MQANADCLGFRRERAEAQKQCSQLSGREGEIMRLVAAGHLNKEIGLHLGISERTVEAHRLHALRKLNVLAGADLTRLVTRLTPEACPHKTRKWCPKCRSQA